MWITFLTCNTKGIYLMYYKISNVYMEIVVNANGHQYNYIFDESVAGENKFNLVWELLQELGQEQHND